LDRTSTGWIAPACLAHSFDHLVGAGEKHRGHVEAEQLSAGTAEQIVERSIRAG
jgi:hypothetical protein